MSRAYTLGRRQPEVDRTRAAILSAARRLVVEAGPGASVSDIARLAGVSRITVYNRFGSKERLLAALAAEADARHTGPTEDRSRADPAAALKRRLEQAGAAWAADPALHRRLESLRREPDNQSDANRELAESLGAHDLLRPGCSIKEAEDVIGILTSFPVFDRLHKGGRRSAPAVAEILMRMASGVLKPGPSD